MDMAAARVSWAKLFLGFGFLLVTTFANAQALEDCLACHEDVEYKSTAHPDVECGECHTNITDKRHKRGVEPLTDEGSCGECHGRTVRTIGRSIHDGEAACIDCHGDPHAIRKVEEADCKVSAVNQIEQCGACHDSPELPLEDYVQSEHGRALLLSGLVAAPSCSSCHGSHKILSVHDDNAPTSHQHVPEMCGTCHALLLEEWQNMSAHGLAWQAGKEGPVCTDCHSSHGIADPISASARLKTPETCGNCHDDELGSFRDSFHGQASDLGMAAGATCSDCHTPHNNLAKEDPRSSIHPDNLVATCAQCHEGITASFTSFNPHNDPTDPDDDFAVYVVWLFMTGLLIGVFAFFGVHDLLWLQRSMVALVRGEFKEERDKHGPYIRRFNAMNISMHIVIITTFLLLALTGLPLKFHEMPWAQTLIAMLGGVDFARVIHRLAAIGTFGYMAFHVGNIFIRWMFRKERGLFWGPDSMTPQTNDVRDFFGNIRYFLYLAERPRGDRWTYWEKFDYLAVFWGVVIIGLSGLMLWFPGFFTRFLPGWTLNAAHVIHADEALLATGFIFIFHFFHTHLRPESFPMDLVVFTGKMPLHRFKAERPLEYQRLVDNNELEDYLVDPPTQAESLTAYIWGTIFLTIGIALAIGIIWALLSH
jgi:cytochrome b subunit of formate dehydrogenase/nitrate/TMAO reductase-like tetraheme cytochrome c subunit